MSAKPTNIEEYEVEKVVDHRYRRTAFPDGSHDEYLIKWKHYPSSQNTWEPEAHLNPLALAEARRFKTDRLRQHHADILTKVDITDKVGFLQGRLRFFPPTPDKDGNLLYHDVDLHEITSTRQNRRILKRIIQNDIDMTDLYIVEEHDEENRRYDGLNQGNNFVPSVVAPPPLVSSLGGRRGGRHRHNNNHDNTTSNYSIVDDMGYLGFFIGKSRTLEMLHIGSLQIMEGGHNNNNNNNNNNFWTGFQHNQSIKSLRFSGCDSIPTILDKMHPFFRHNGNLTKIELTECPLGMQGAKQFAQALGECTHKKSLRCVRLNDNELPDRGLKKIIRALLLHENIEGLTVSDNDVGLAQCRALGEYLKVKADKLQDLNLSHNLIDDEGIAVLMDGLLTAANNNDDNNNSDDEVCHCALKQLCLSGNSAISSSGLRTVTTLMTKPTCNLEQLWLYHMNIGDEGASVLADGLAKNTSLKKLWFNPSTCGITSVGWGRFTTLLCDTSSVNNTYLSNHTIELIGKYYSNYARSDDQIPRIIGASFRVNNFHHLSTNQRAYWKILSRHRELRMEPFFEWKLKFLPMTITWFENTRAVWDGRRARSVKLSCIFQFVRGMPFYFGNDSGLAVVQPREEATIQLSPRKRGRGRHHACSSLESLRREQKKRKEEEELEEMDTAELIRRLAECARFRRGVTAEERR